MTKKQKQKSCFAYTEGNKFSDNHCSATISQCDPFKCPFYKSKEQERQELREHCGVNSITSACRKYEYLHPDKVNTNEE